MFRSKNELDENYLQSEYGRMIVAQAIAPDRLSS